MPTAMEIFKLLPQTNCGDCGFPTCLAFAMQLANQKVELEDCPNVSDDAKAELEASSAPPIKLVKVGTGENQIEMGDETELYRHEKKFFHPVAFALTVSDKASDEEIEAKVNKANGLQFERVGQIIKMDMVGVRDDSGDADAFAEVVEKVANGTELPLILFSKDPESIKAAASRIADKKPLLHAATVDNADQMASVADELDCPLVVFEDGSLDELADLVDKVKKAGVEKIVIDFGSSDLKELLEKSTIVRRISINKTFRGLGYPIFVNALDGDKSVLKGIVATMKYGSVVAFDELKVEHALPLFVLRQNIYTDPQVPIQVEPKLYAVNDPDEDSPIVFTTNFSLTYFTVIGDVEKSKKPVWLQVVDTEGLSVMTAFAAGKLTPELVAKALEDSDAQENSKRGEIIIPGMVSRMSGKLEELTGLDVIVGPQESSGIPKLLKSMD